MYGESSSYCVPAVSSNLRKSSVDDSEWSGGAHIVFIMTNCSRTVAATISRQKARFGEKNPSKR